MKIHLIALCLVATGRLLSQEAPSIHTPSDRALFQVLAESVVRKADGGTLTFRKVSPPAELLAARTPASVPVAPTTEQMERLRRVAMKRQHHLTISATSHEGGLTLLRWTCDGKSPLQAWSRVDFRLMPDWASVETETAVYSFLKTTRPSASLTPKQMAQANRLPSDDRPLFVLLDERIAATAEEKQAVEGMEALHAYFETNREALMQRHAQMQSDRAAGELEKRHAPPPPPKHEVIHFWPLPKTAGKDASEVKSEGGTK